MSSVAAEPLPTRDEVPDYELPDIIVADQPHQLKALGDRTARTVGYYRELLGRLGAKTEDVARG